MALKKKVEIVGNINFSEDWTVFAPLNRDDPPPEEGLEKIPGAITVAGRKLEGVKVGAERSQVNLASLLGEMPRLYKVAWVFIPLEADDAQEATLGFGADWWFEAYLNGRAVVDTLEKGNISSPPSINDFKTRVRLRKGRNVLAVRFISGLSDNPVLAAGGPRELRAGDFRTILYLPPPLDWDGLCRKYPPDPEAPIKWVVPETFEFEKPGLGLPRLEGVEHFETFVPRPSSAPVDEGGTGFYEGLEHGMFNHNIGVAVFRDRLITSWINHSLDEDAPGGRVLGRAGRILDEEGRVAWDEPGSLVELAPQPVPVRRVRQMQDYDRDMFRGFLANGSFQLIGKRLFFCSSLWGRHGLSDDHYNRLGEKKLIPDENFYFERPGKSVLPVPWHFPVRFYREWDIRDGCLQPVSPIYREGEIPRKLELTPTISIPAHELTRPYEEAIPLSNAPEEIRELIHGETHRSFVRSPRYRPGTGNLAADGHHGLSHHSEFQRPDGTRVVLRDNLKPERQFFYYAAEKEKEEGFYPPARRTNLFGSVQPAAGEIPGLGVFIAGNSRNRRNMYLTFSRDGRVFDRTWNLLYISLENVTPGYAKAQGSVGAGPQYMRPAIVGRSAWLVYSISKERVGATRVPFDALR